MRISKIAREEAIEECLDAADARRARIDHDVPEGDTIAWAAWHAVNLTIPETSQPIDEECADLWLEAAALLRAGWSPGESVELIKEQT